MSRPEVKFADALITARINGAEDAVDHLIANADRTELDAVADVLLQYAVTGLQRAQEAAGDLRPLADVWRGTLQRAAQREAQR